MEKKVFQRKSNMKLATINDGSRVQLADLIKFCQQASIDLSKNGDDNSSIRFEIFADYLREDYRGGKLMYNSNILGL